MVPVFPPNQGPVISFSAAAISTGVLTSSGNWVNFWASSGHSRL